MHVYFCTILMTFKFLCNGWDVCFPPPPVDERGRDILRWAQKWRERIDNLIFMSRIFIVFPTLARGANRGHSSDTRSISTQIAVRSASLQQYKQDGKLNYKAQP